jgi:hypothetical protein
LLDKDTEAPPVGAAPLRVTVAAEDVRLATLAGLTATEERVTAPDDVMLSAAVVLTLP